ncbi:hypothetical protein MNAN1_001337 [Malassezia nana]|uniref:ERCC4 domain-containing protein n=1 Tax=Malassezia nana TaxID=180528 RepID=A0AAF0EP77_9BASI|nr:hypothetical protein MNAN1_001337 [Malassezia nana]
MWTEPSPSNPGPANVADNHIPSSPTAWPRSPTLHVSGHSSTVDVGLTQVPLIHSNSPSPEPLTKRRRAPDTAKKASNKEERVQALSERQRWREANRTRHRKSDTMRDLIVQWDTSLFAPGTGLLCKVHDTIHERLSAEMVTVEPRDISLTERLQSHRFGIVRFKRKVRSRYDPVQKWWEPLDEETCVSESTIVMVAQGEQVLAAVEDGSLADRIHANTSGHDQSQRLLLVIGLEAHLRHLRNQANRAFAAGVRQHIQGQGPVASVTIPSDLASEKVERALLLLQIQHRCHVVRAATPEEAVEWLYAISSDVSFRPYKLLQSAPMARRSTKTSADSKEIYRAMLEEIVRRKD